MTYITIGDQVWISASHWGIFLWKDGTNDR